MKLELRFHPRERGEAWMEPIAGAALEAWKTCAPKDSLTLTFSLEGETWKLREDGTRTPTELCLAQAIERRARLSSGTAETPAALVLTWKR